MVITIVFLHPFSHLVAFSLHFPLIKIKIYQQQILNMIQDIQPQNQLNFYTDLINSVVFDTPVPFLKKYPKLSHYQTILTHQQNILALLYRVVGQEITSNDLISSLQTHLQSSTYPSEMLAKIIKSKYVEIKNQLIKRQIRLGSSMILGHNWKLKNVMGCSSHTHKNKMLIRLQLITIEGEGVTQEQQTLALELTVPETKELVLKLKEMKNDMKFSKF